MSETPDPENTIAAAVKRAQNTANPTNFPEALQHLVATIQAQPRYPRWANTPTGAAKTEINQLVPSEECPDPSRKLWFLGDFALKTMAMVMEHGVHEGPVYSGIDRETVGRAMFLCVMIQDETSGKLDVMSSIPPHSEPLHQDIRDAAKLLMEKAK